MKNWRERQRGKKGKIRRNGNREVGGGEEVRQQQREKEQQKADEIKVKRKG